MSSYLIQLHRRPSYFNIFIGVHVGIPKIRTDDNIQIKNETSMKILNLATWEAFSQLSEFDIAHTLKSLKRQLKKSIIDQIMHIYSLTSNLHGSNKDTPKFRILDTNNRKHISLSVQ